MNFKSKAKSQVSLSCTVPRVQESTEARMDQQPEVVDVFVSYADAHGEWAETWVIPRLKTTHLSMAGPLGEMIR